MLINIDWTEKKPPSARPGGTTCWPLWPPAAGTFVSSRASPRLAAPSTHKTNVASSGQKAFEVKELLKNKFSGKEWWKTPRCELRVSGFVFPGWVLSRTGCSFQVLAAFACGLFVLLCVGAVSSPASGSHRVPMCLPRRLLPFPIPPLPLFHFQPSHHGAEVFVEFPLRANSQAQNFSSPVLWGL